MYEEVSESLADKYELLPDVIDVRESQDFEERKFSGFSLDDLEIVLEADDYELPDSIEKNTPIG